MSLSVVILAAGLSTRFKSATPKVLHPLVEQPLLAYSLDLAATLSAEPPVLIIGPETEAEIRAWVGERARCVVQEPRLGTGHAAMQAAPLLTGRTEQVLVLYGDMPLLRESTLRALVEQQQQTQAAVAVLTVERSDPRGFGRIVRNSAGDITAIIEDHEASPEVLAILELNTGIFAFRADFLWGALPQLQPSPRKGEYYLTDVIALAANAGERVVGVLVEDASEGLGINTRVDMALAAAALRERINTHWMLAGVTIVDPATTYIGPRVTLGRDTVIHPNTHLRGQTAIGAGCAIGPNSIIQDCTLGDRCQVVASVLEQAVMEDESNIGPFGHLRKGARLCVGAHMGNFGEL